MSEDKKEDRPIQPFECPECEGIVQPYEPMALYEYEWCHLDCAYRAMDNDDGDFHQPAYR